MKLLLASLLILIPFTVHAEYLGNLSVKALPPEQRIEKISNALLIINHQNLGHVPPEQESL